MIRPRETYAKKAVEDTTTLEGISPELSKALKEYYSAIKNALNWSGHVNLNISENISFSFIGEWVKGKIDYILEKLESVRTISEESSSQKIYKKFGITLCNWGDLTILPIFWKSEDPEWEDITFVI